MVTVISYGFQCSSASRKFLNPLEHGQLIDRQTTFQCSSASRKFLNPTWYSIRSAAVSGFSALQRAENSSISTLTATHCRYATVSVLFSEPKIPQSHSLIRQQ